MAVTEDRIDVFVNVLDRRVIDSIPLADGEIIYAGTLAAVSGGEISSYEHTPGDDDSGLQLRAVLKHMERGQGAISNLTATYPGGPQDGVQAFSGVLIELETHEGDTTGYDQGATVYAADNASVTLSQGDGSGGTYPIAGRVYDINAADDTVKVLVEGIDA